MARVFIALIVGIAIGAAVFLFMPEEPSPPSTQPAGLAQRAREIAAPSAGSGAFVSTTQPGLVVTVTRGGTAEVQARVELTRAQRSIGRGEVAWEPAGAETTDAQGRAEFPASTGRYFVSALATDGTRAVESVDVSWGSGPTFVSLTLKPGTLFTGQVLDAATGQPIPRAAIRPELKVDGDDVAASLAGAATLTDSLGRFALQLPEQRWRFQARAPGYLEAGEEPAPPSKEVTIVLTRGAQLSGLVVDRAGSPIADATVRINPADVTSLTTDSDGRFEVTVARGPISLHALAPDGRQGLSRVSLTEKDERAQVRIVVEDGTELSGLVRDQRGPVAHAEVRILAEPESLEVASFDTANDGRFSAKGLPPGRYSVRAQQGLGRRAVVVGIELPRAAPVELVLSTAGRVVGAVNDADGRPSEGADVSLRWPSGLNEVRRTARTDSDGRFEFDDLLPAEVFVQAKYSDLVSEEEAAYVAPGATVELVLTTAPQGRLVGTVTGAAIDKVIVRSNRPGSELIKIDQIARRFEKLLAPGSYHLFAEVKLTAGHDGQFVERQVVEVRPGEITTVVLDVPDTSPVPGHHNLKMHPELGSGLSFENSPGGVRVDFLMADCPAAKAGVRLGDLVVAIDGESTRDALDAFARVRKASDGATLELLVRREGQDLKLTLR